MIFQKIGSCWDEPADNANAMHNLKVLGIGARREVEARGPDFSPGARSILAPSRSYGQWAQIDADRGTPTLLVIDAP